MALKKVGALWLKKKDGKTFMSGRLEQSIPASSQLLVYKNDFKKEDKHPDYTLHVIEDDQPAPRNEYQQAPTNPTGPPPDGDIPF